MDYKYQNEIMQTNPELPLGDSFSSNDFEYLSQNESFSVTCNETDVQPKQPYVFSFQKNMRTDKPKELPQNNEEEKKILGETTVTTDISRRTKKKFRIGIPSQSFKDQVTPYYALKRNKRTVSVSTFMKLNRKNNLKKKESLESSFLKNYWQTKNEIEKK